MHWTALTRTQWRSWRTHARGLRARTLKDWLSRHGTTRYWAAWHRTHGPRRGSAGLNRGCNGLRGRCLIDRTRAGLRNDHSRRWCLRDRCNRRRGWDDRTRRRRKHLRWLHGSCNYWNCRGRRRWRRRSHRNRRRRRHCSWRSGNWRRHGWRSRSHRLLYNLRYRCRLNRWWRDWCHNMRRHNLRRRDRRRRRNGHCRFGSRRRNWLGHYWRHNGPGWMRSRGLLLLGNCLEHISRAGNVRQINLGLDFLFTAKRARGLCRLESGLGRAAQMDPHFFRFMLLKRARVGLLFGNADNRQHVKNRLALNFQFPCEIVDSNLTHPPFLVPRVTLKSSSQPHGVSPLRTFAFKRTMIIQLFLEPGSLPCPAPDF